ncbi:MAG TPA: carbonic anhydrase [Acidimicrobiales bacterium]|jgi:carbonic anhydrase|nr:carbonic anhydrase [Acidimicrobiales bacterium]
MTVTDQLLTNNDAYAAGFDKGDLPLPPARKVAVLACMDARLDPARVLGLDEGDAHVIRNAGGVVSDDALRSLVISQRLLGTEEIVLIHHTDCGMLTFSDDEVKAAIEADTGIRPSFALEAFSDPVTDVRQSVARITASPFLRHKDNVRGFVYDVKTGRLDEVI